VTEAPALAELERAWARSDQLFALVRPSAFLDQPIPLRQPILFYVGHLPAFAWNQLGRGVLGRAPFRSDFDALFERGIDPVDDHVPSSDWPAEREVLAYRDRVRDEIRRTAGDLQGEASEDGLGAGAGRLAMVLEHELMHHETLLYMLAQMPAERLDTARLPPPALGPGRPARWAAVPAGRVRLGVPDGHREWVWDNERPAAELDVAAFELQTLPVSHRDVLSFVEDGGYEAQALWGAEGWAWRTRRGLRFPMSWDAALPSAVRGLHGALPFAEVADWPASLSWAEADAYARWAGARLPTEVELARAEEGSAPGNHNFVRWSPEPRGARPESSSTFGIEDLVGNGWEWTSTPLAPRPGFRPDPAYPGYTADFFDGRHYVIRGASWATDARLVRPSFRNWFQPHYPYVFSKLRCARDLA
jgi:ergothioneine biosynthesis protein EgtB